LWIITFITSIPARFFLYAPVLDHEGKEQMASELPLLVPLAGLEPATSCLVLQPHFGWGRLLAS
jgi:hypothetical protein